MAQKDSTPVLYLQFTARSIHSTILDYYLSPKCSMYFEFLSLTLQIKAITRLDRHSAD